MSLFDIFRKKQSDNVALSGHIPLRDESPKPPVMPQINNDFIKNVFNSKAKSVQSPQQSIMDYLGQHFNSALPQWQQGVKDFYSGNQGPAHEYQPCRSGTHGPLLCVPPAVSAG